MTKALCSIQNCNKKVVGKGYCENHYRRFRRYGDPMKGYQSPNKTKATCSVPKCTNLRQGTTYCSTHLNHIKKYGKIIVRPTLTDEEKLIRKREVWKRANRKYRTSNKEAHRQAVKNSYKNWKESGKDKEKAARRRARKLNATPSWLTAEHKQTIKSMYENCPPGHQVDHIVPLVGVSKLGGEQIVCGLHVPWNLQYLTLEENARKRNCCE